MSFSVAPPEPPTLRDVDPNEYDDAEVVGQTDWRCGDLGNQNISKTEYNPVVTLTG